jgi:hypothetical protein
VPRPSFLIFTDGGYQIIYLLREVINVEFFRPPMNEEQKQVNEEIKTKRLAITTFAKDFETRLRLLIPSELKPHLKIASVSNLDRVLRLPWTINFPNKEKQARGQTEALARIAVDYDCKCDFSELRQQIPFTVAPLVSKKPFVAPPDPAWPPYRKAMFSCEFLCEGSYADSNDIFTNEVMLPLINSAYDGDLTLERAEDCFLVAISGGARFGTPGRDMNYFRKKFKSHLGSRRENCRKLGSLIRFCHH